MKDFPIVECPWLKGSNRAVLLNGALCLSPAMMSLIRGAENEEELKRILEALPVVDMGMGVVDVKADLQVTEMEDR